MVEASYIFLCFPNAKGRLLKALWDYINSPNEIRWAQGLQLDSSQETQYWASLSEVHSQSLMYRYAPVWNCQGNYQGGSPWHMTPENGNLLLLVLKPSQLVISGSSKPGRWHFILGPLGRDRSSQGEHLHSAQYREVVNCLYGPTSPGRARRHLCVKTLHPGGGKKNTKKIKREKYRMKWKLPIHLMD